MCDTRHKFQELITLQIIAQSLHFEQGFSFKHKLMWPKWFPIKCSNQRKHHFIWKIRQNNVSLICSPVQDKCGRAKVLNALSLPINLSLFSLLGNSTSVEYSSTAPHQLPLLMLSQAVYAFIYQSQVSFIPGSKPTGACLTACKYKSPTGLIRLIEQSKSDGGLDKTLLEGWTQVDDQCF